MTTAQKDAPLAALLCFLTGVPTTLLGLCFHRLIIPDGEQDGGCFWGLVYLAGAGMTVILGLISLSRREGWTRWTVLCVLAALSPIPLGLVLSR